MILNLVLLALPVSVIAFAYLSFQVFIWLQEKFTPQGPIVYDTELVGLSGSVWPLIAYLIVPNGLTMIYLLHRTRLQRERE
ncbi:MAG: hypothetical protein WBD20_13305 [Pirellulaceae bacterium]